MATVYARKLLSRQPKAIHLFAFFRDFIAEVSESTHYLFGYRISGMKRYENSKST